MEQRPKRKPTRLPTFDYNGIGTYFLTLCTKEKRCTLGQVSSAANETECPTIQLSPIGILIENQIQTMAQFYAAVSVDHFVIMPNHVHLLLSVCEERSNTTPANAAIPMFISALKRFSNKQAGENLWQRSYHDHIVRNEQDYLRIWQYIDTNASKWEADCFYQA